MGLQIVRDRHHQFFISVYTSTDATTNQYVCGGGLDLGLNDDGMDDSRKLARRFQKNPLKVKKIITGPELRTIQHADFLHDEMKGKMTIFREFGDQIMGDLEGKPVASGQDEKNPPRGESFVDFSVRVHNGLLRVLQEKDLCLVVAHPRVAHVIFSWIGLEEEKVEAGVMYAIDLPAGTGHAHHRKV